MAWISCTTILDPDKTGATQPMAGNVTAVFTYSDGTPPFTYQERLDKTMTSGFPARAKTARTQYEAIVAKQNSTAAQILTALQTQDP